jgi:uncharacterized membrane protein YbhN (UPF0104 family)
LFRVLSLTWVKVLIAVGIVTLLVYFNRLDATVLSGLARTWPWLLAAFLLMLPSFVVVSCRFKIILDSQGIDVTTIQAVRWSMIGSFFDLAMPSASGGDLVKLGYLANYVGAGHRVRAMVAVGLDRLLGLIGLFLLAFIGSAVGWNILQDLPARNTVVVVSLSASLGTLLFLRVAGSRRLNQNHKVDRFLSQHAWGLHIKKLIASFNSLRERPDCLFVALGLSVINHAFWCASLFCIVKAVGNTVEPMRGFVVFPLAIFSNIFGVAGGFGVGTAGFDLIFSQLLAISNGALIGLLFQTLSAFARLAGLPFYLFSRPNEAMNGSELQMGGEKSIG